MIEVIKYDAHSLSINAKRDGLKQVISFSERMGRTGKSISVLHSADTGKAQRWTEVASSFTVSGSFTFSSLFPGYAVGS